VRLNSLDEASITSLQHTLAQLYYHNEQYLKTVETLHLWLKHPKNTQITAEDYYLLALAHYQLADCRQSIDAAKQGLTIEPAAPDAFWQLILNCQLQQENYRDAVKSLTTLLALQPNEISYWTQWVLVQQQLQNTPEVLAALELMEMKGWLQTEPLALLYVHLLVQQGNPAKAATQLAQFMENKVIDKNTKQELYLAQLWAQAGETARALPLFRHLKQSSDLAQADLVLLDQWLAYLKSRQPY
jgi:tetratricopeptide (TPR) repeat protein